jgi:hypothetical protein
MTGEIPFALRNRPTLDGRLGFYLRAFDRCSSSREWHEGAPASIKLSEIKAYCWLLELDDLELRELVIDHIQALDEVFRAHCAKVASASKPAVAGDPVPTR